MHGETGDWQMGGVWPWWALGVALIVGLILWFAIAHRRRSAGAGMHEDVLKHRYAEGLIDREEYETKLTDLRK